ncbi:MAG: hypothetical protein AAB472_03135 [Patescibacteria group bacterium]
MPTEPIPWLIVALVALFVVQEIVEAPPSVTELGFEEREQTGGGTSTGGMIGGGGTTQHGGPTMMACTDCGVTNPPAKAMPTPIANTDTTVNTPVNTGRFLVSEIVSMLFIVISSNACK